jgi:predicted CXXCH cytochrome family protein
VSVPRQEGPPVSDNIKRSASSFISVLAAAGFLCFVATSGRAVDASKTNRTEDAALLQSVLGNETSRSLNGAVPSPSASAVTNVAPVATNLTTTTTNVVVPKPESTKHKILKFLIDGVPPEGATNSVTKRVTPRRDNQLKRRHSVLETFRFSEVSMTNLNVHPPYAANDCEKCHGHSVQNPVLKLPQKELCLQCHQKNFPQPVAVQHKPVENGECASCHDPHRSPNKKLLRKTGNALCVTCHKEKDAAALAPVVHAPLQMEGCIECHLPHGGPNAFLTKKPGKDLCYECHDDFTTKGKFIHAPVQSGDCVICHEPHATKNQKLLRREGAETCFECHDDFQNGIKTAKFVHAPMQDNNCTMCHDPHATNERAMLKKSGSGVCFECHEQKDLAVIKGHAGIQDKVCFECHNPHFSEQAHLLKPDKILKQLTAK